jgi:hypothetical protein
MKISARHIPKRNSQIDASVLTSFCPDILLDSIIHSNSTENMFFDAACLLADISGFVKLTGDLCSCGVEGFDDLRQCTSNFIGELINIIYYHGGDGN